MRLVECGIDVPRGFYGRSCYSKKKKKHPVYAVCMPERAISGLRLQRSLLYIDSLLYVSVRRRLAIYLHRTICFQLQIGIA